MQTALAPACAPRTGLANQGPPKSGAPSRRSVPLRRLKRYKYRSGPGWVKVLRGRNQGPEIRPKSFAG